MSSEGSKLKGVLAGSDSNSTRYNSSWFIYGLEAMVAGQV